MNFWKHLHTINRHRRLVRKSCFRVGLYRQGLMHDLSKYSPAEFWVGVKYYQGNRSPNTAEREDKGYTSAWLHHKGRNKHHLEYWIDYSNPGDPDPVAGMCMPKRYVVEMFFDRVAACKTYQGDRYTDQSPLDYYQRGKGRTLLHPETRELLERLLSLLAQEGEDTTYGYIRHNVLGK